MIADPVQPQQASVRKMKAKQRRPLSNRKLVLDANSKEVPVCRESVLTKADFRYYKEDFRTTKNI